jgi:hypothetical protein
MTWKEDFDRRVRLAFEIPENAVGVDVDTTTSYEGASCTCCSSPSAVVEVSWCEPTEGHPGRSKYADREVSMDEFITMLAAVPEEGK